MSESEHLYNFLRRIEPNLWLYVDECRDSVGRVTADERKCTRDRSGISPMPSWTDSRGTSLCPRAVYRLPVWYWSVPRLCRSVNCETRSHVHSRRAHRLTECLRNHKHISVHILTRIPSPEELMCITLFTGMILPRMLE